MCWVVNNKKLQRSCPDYIFIRGGADRECVRDILKLGDTGKDKERKKTVSETDDFCKGNTGGLLMRWRLAHNDRSG